MTAKKVKLKLNAYAIVSDGIEPGVRYGINRYYKYRDEQEVVDLEALVSEIVSGVMLELDNIINWNHSR